MKVITVTGEQNTGKSSTIRKVYQMLWYDKTNPRRISFETDGGDKCDFISILNWKKKIIVFKSLGDKNDEGGDEFAWVKQGLDVAKAVKADILINALTTDLDEKKYKSFINTIDELIFKPIEKKDTIEEMARQEEDLSKQIFKELKKMVVQ